MLRAKGWFVNEMQFEAYRDLGGAGRMEPLWRSMGTFERVGAYPLTASVLNTLSGAS